MGFNLGFKGLMLRLRMSAAVPLLPLCAFLAWTGTSPLPCTCSVPWQCRSRAYTTCSDRSTHSSKIKTFYAFFALDLV